MKKKDYSKMTYQEIDREVKKIRWSMLYLLMGFILFLGVAFALLNGGIFK